MPVRYSNTDTEKIKNRELFFDANVLIYIFWPSSRYDWQIQYSRLYAFLIENNNSLFINISVLSEVINRVLRMDYQLHCHTTNKDPTKFSFKQYRDSQDGIETQQLIYEVITSKILTKFKLYDTSMNIEDLRKVLIVDSLDFGDKIILNDCKKHNCVLITNDSDYKKTDIDIMSANPKLLEL